MFSVGIADFTCPVRIPEKSGGIQQTVAGIGLWAELEAACPGMPAATPAALIRDLLAERLPDIHSGIFPELLAAVRDRLGARSARIAMRFPYFIRKTAPASGTESLMEYRGAFAAGSDAQTGEPELTALVPVTTLCPCSKAISRFGAHNQRAAVRLAVQPRALVWLEDLIALVESCGSSEVYALLKRPDEKFVTEWAYEHPMFVEDVARMVAQKAAAHPDIHRFSVAVESFESIHRHNAFALVDSDSMGL